MNSAQMLQRSKPLDACRRASYIGRNRLALW